MRDWLRSGWRALRRFLSADGFALAPVWIQLAAIFVGSALLILLMSPLIGDLSTSYRWFADPSSYADAAGSMQLVFGLLQVVFGLILFSFIISVLSASLEQLIENIKGGNRPYRKSGHLMIVNFNVKLPLILDEINLRAQRLGRDEDIVLLFPDRTVVDHFCEHMEYRRWPRLQLYVRQGDPLSWASYERLNIAEALGIVVLAAESFEESFVRDNFNLKILASLINEQSFFNHLAQRHAEHRPVKCSIELSNETYSRDIALALTGVEGGSLFAVTTPGDVIGGVLARSMVDIVYYKAFFELLSFHGSTVQFVDPRRFNLSATAASLPFEQLLLDFNGGTLVGYSRSYVDGRFDLQLCPFGRPMQANDWLLFITDDHHQLDYAPTEHAPLQVDPRIQPPSEIVNRRLCIIGDAWPIEIIGNFIDEESRTALRDSHFVFADPMAYFDPLFVARMRIEDYDNIVVNLPDELGFRLTLLLLSASPPDDPFLEKIVTVLTDPTIEELLNKNVRYRNTVLSHKLAAKYIAQLSFQKNLEKFFAELAMPEGVEFNLLKVGKHLPRELLTDESAVRRLLAARELVFLGVVDSQRRVRFANGHIDDADQLLVMGHGER
jgi:hypothetical protein